MAHNLSASKRLKKELINLQKSAGTGDDDDVYLRPASPTNIMKWNALIKGPADTPYYGGIYALKILCLTDYPLTPPTITFKTKVFHPNVHFTTGAICLDILKKEWSPAWSLQAACRAVLSLLTEPAADSPLNCDAGNMIRAGDMMAFESTARMYNVENGYGFRWPITEEVVEVKVEVESLVIDEGEKKLEVVKGGGDGATAAADADVSPSACLPTPVPANLTSNPNPTTSNTQAAKATLPIKIEGSPTSNNRKSVNENEVIPPVTSNVRNVAMGNPLASSSSTTNNNNPPSSSSSTADDAVAGVASGGGSSSISIPVTATVS